VIRTRLDPTHSFYSPRRTSHSHTELVIHSYVRRAAASLLVSAIGGGGVAGGAAAAAAAFAPFALLSEKERTDETNVRRLERSIMEDNMVFLLFVKFNNSGVLTWLDSRVRCSLFVPTSKSQNKNKTALLMFQYDCIIVPMKRGRR
jgi:hypothetical protein